MVVAIVVVLLAIGAAIFATQGPPVTTTSPSSSTQTTGLTSSPTPTTTTSSTSSLPNQLIIDEASSPSSDDPGAVIDNNGIELAQNTVLPLIFYNKSDNSLLVPVLARSWNQTQDGLTYTFSLRTDAYFSNGDPFNAYVVWYNIYRDLLINQPIDFVMYEYFNTSGVSESDVNALNNPGNIPNSSLLQVTANPDNSVTVIDKSTVQFHLTNPFAAFLSTLSDSPWYFVDPYVVEQHGGVVTNQPNTWMSVNGTTVGDGPYVTQTYLPNQFAVLVANPHYWAQNVTDNFYVQAAKIQKIIINYKTDELTRILDLTTNRVQSSIISFNDVNSTLAQTNHIYLPNAGLSGTVEALFLNTEKPPLDNLLVRRAIVDAINVSQILQVAYNGLVIPYVGPDLTNFPGYNNSIRPPSYDLTEAKALLSQAGFPNGQGLPPLTFAYVTSPYQSLIAQLLVSQLNQVGITVKPLAYPLPTFVIIQSTPGTNDTAPNLISLSGWTFQPDVTGYWPLVDDQQGVFHFLKNQTIHNLILQSNSELNPQLRAQLISQVTELVLQQAAVVWIGQGIDEYDTGAGQGPVIWNTCVVGMWYNTAFNGVPFNSASYSCVPTT